MRRCRQAILFATVWCIGMTSVVAETPDNPLLGKWKHSSGKINLTIEAHRLHFICVDDKAFSLHADYNITRDHTVFGLITRVEGDEVLRQSLGLDLLDEPFVFSRVSCWRMACW